MVRPPAEPEIATADSTVFRQFVARPRQIGAIRRSSPALGRAIAAALRWPSDGVVIEAGPGDGAITECLLATKPEATPFFAVEVNPVCAAAFARRLPQVQLVRDDLQNLPAICAAQGIGKASAVVATLPWSVLPQEKQQSLLDAILESLAPDGQLLFYVYIQALPFWRRSPFAKRLENSFESVEHGRMVWRNVPPAVVFACRDPRR